MKKRFGLYTAVWAVSLVLFNVISFVSVGWAGQEKYTSSFWIGYSFITAMFIGQLICSFMAFKADSGKKMFYRLSLIATSYSGLVASLIFGGLCMLIPQLPYWVGVILCTIILCLNIVAIIKASAAIEEIERVDENVKEKTFFIKSLTIDANTLMMQAKSSAVKAECGKVYEAFKYSDPISTDELASIEAQITIQFHALKDAVDADDVDLVKATADNLNILLSDRNKKCKMLK